MTGDSPQTADPQTQPTSLWGRIKGRFLRQAPETSLRESLESVIDEHSENLIIRPDDLSQTERVMLRNVLAYGDLRVEDVAVPRADIIAFDIDNGFEDLVGLLARAGHSRLPVYRETLDVVIGMVHVKDVYQHLALESEKGAPRIDRLLRSVLFVPPSMRVLDLLARMRASRTHIAIVVDEYGGTDGIVTIEDLVEQIVGDIEDEHDQKAEDMLVLQPDNSYFADARMPLPELEERLACDFLSEEDDDEVDTLGGLLFMLVGRVPVIGEVIDHELGYRFEVVDGDPRRVTRVRIIPPALARGARGAATSQTGPAADAATQSSQNAAAEQGEADGLEGPPAEGALKAAAR